VQECAGASAVGVPGATCVHARTHARMHARRHFIDPTEVEVVARVCRVEDPEDPDKKSAAAVEQADVVLRVRCEGKMGTGWRGGPACLYHPGAPWR
jgi:hypothetical protein